MFTLILYLMAFARGVRLPFKYVWYVPVADIIITAVMVSKNWIN